MFNFDEVLFFFFFFLVLWFSYMRNHCLFLVVFIFVWKFYSYSSYIWVFGLFLVDFCTWCEIRIHLHSFACATQSSQHYLLKRLFFPSFECSWHYSWKSVDYKCYGLFLDFQLYSLIYMLIIMPVPHCFDYRSFVVLKSGSVSLSTLFFSRLFCLFEFLAILHEF